MGFEERNKRIAARWFEEYWNNANTDVVDELCSENVHMFFPLARRAYDGKDEVKSIIGPMHDAIEGYHFDTTGPLIVEGDTVLCRWRATGKVVKDFGDFPGNGTTIDFTGVAIYRINDDGLIEEEFTEEDSARVYLQLGLLKL